MSESEGRDYRSVGEILRDARKERGWSVQEVSSRTRIAPRLVRAVECDDLEQLSGSLYARGFVRSLGELYHLDVAWLLTKLSAAGVASDPTDQSRPAAVEPPPTVQSAPNKPAGATPDQEESGPVWKIETARVRRVEPVARPLPWTRILVGVAAVALVAVALWIGPGLFDGISSLAGRLVTSAETESPTQIVAAPAAVDTTAQADSTLVDAAADEPSQAIVPSEERTTPASAVEVTTVVEPPPATETQRLGRETARLGLGSVVRDAESSDRPAMVVRVTAVERVETYYAVDGSARQRRVLRAGEFFEAEGFDHIALKVDLPRSIRIELDGELYPVSSSWTGSEIMIYPTRLGRN